MRKQFLLNLNDVNQIKKFITKVNQINENIKLLLLSDNHKIDARSILGILSLDLSKPVILEASNLSLDDMYKLHDYLLDNYFVTK